MQTETFNYTGGEQTWTVPYGIRKVTVKCYGAGGGDHEWNNITGGDGGYAEGIIPVSPGQTLRLYVGESGEDGEKIRSTSFAGEDPTAVGGNGGWNGGADGGNANGSEFQGEDLGSGAGGGGATDIRIGGSSLSDRALIAGGGGGAGAADGAGGGGGGTNGGNGGGDVGGGGGTQSSGGSGSDGGGDGSLGSGGRGDDRSTSNTDAKAGGGGGGGYYGGGGGGSASGNDNHGGGGGGGGSAFADTSVTNTAFTAGAGNSTDGQIVIEYDQTPLAPYNLTADPNQNDGTVQLDWENNDQDTDEFLIYRDTQSPIEYIGANLIKVISDTNITSWLDDTSHLDRGDKYYYAITGTYVDGGTTISESDPSNEVDVQLARTVKVKLSDGTFKECPIAVADSNGDFYYPEDVYTYNSGTGNFELI